MKHRVSINSRIKGASLWHTNAQSAEQSATATERTTTKTPQLIASMNATKTAKRLDTDAEMA